MNLGGIEARRFVSPCQHKRIDQRSLTQQSIETYADSLMP
jgi:hypothetical protein